MATSKRVFTLRLSEDVLDKIGKLATKEHRSVTNYIESAPVSVSGAKGETSPHSTREPVFRT